MRQSRKAAFVLAVGGLEDRLGNNDIKVALLVKTITGTSFLRHDIVSILALQEADCMLAQGRFLGQGEDVGSDRYLARSFWRDKGKISPVHCTIANVVDFHFPDIDFALGPSSILFRQFLDHLSASWASSPS